MPSTTGLPSLLFLRTARKDDPDGLIEEAGKNLDSTAASLIRSSRFRVGGSHIRPRVAPLKPVKLDLF